MDANVSFKDELFFMEDLKDLKNHYNHYNQEKITQIPQINQINNINQTTQTIQTEFYEKEQDKSESINSLKARIEELEIESIIKNLDYKKLRKEFNEFKSEIMSILDTLNKKHPSFNLPPPSPSSSLSLPSTSLLPSSLPFSSLPSYLPSSSSSSRYDRYFANQPINLFPNFSEDFDDKESFSCSPISCSRSSYSFDEDDVVDDDTMMRVSFSIDDLEKEINKARIWSSFNQQQVQEEQQEEQEEEQEQQRKQRQQQYSKGKNRYDPILNFL
ncbi:hypothetical protein RhiirA5_494029 [Rhizophagus irregularis]|uniref:Uncharacterized protein n=1 Tax=Rhizophagus irregularis TaxID=588596 RepID=A0A2N0QAL1_9GLOM|nr:hypothetical protein RhiirA5_494029 [Rhizophagus irregularis]